MDNSVDGYRLFPGMVCYYHDLTQFHPSCWMLVMGFAGSGCSGCKENAAATSACKGSVNQSACKNCCEG